MAYSNASLCALCGFIIAAVTNFYGVSAEKSKYVFYSNIFILFC